MANTMISADDHIDLGYLPRDLWTARLPASLRERAPHVEDRGDKGEHWVCDGETWAEYRGERIYFCTQACLDVFLLDPDPFMAGEIEHPT